MNSQYDPNTNWRTVFWKALGRFGAERCNSSFWFVMLGLGVIALAALHVGIDLTGTEFVVRTWLLLGHLPVSGGMFVRALHQEGMLR